MVRSVVVREAVEADLPAILRIHDAAMSETTSLWDVNPADLYDRVECQKAGDDEAWPVLVAVTGGVIAGYASFGPWRTQAGYDHTVENSLFVAEKYRSQGIGGALLRELIARARKADVHAMIAGIESGNTVSIALHEKHGFETVARLPEVGRKFDRWLDLTLVQLILRDRLTDRLAHLVTGI